MINLKKPEIIQLTLSILLSLIVVILLFYGSSTRKWLGFDEAPAIRLGAVAIFVSYLALVAAILGLSMRVAKGFRSVLTQGAILCVSLSFSLRSLKSLMSSMASEGVVAIELMVFAALSIFMLNISGLLIITYFREK